MDSAAILSPAITGGTTRRFSSSLPCATIGGSAMPCEPRLACTPPQPARAISSAAAMPIEHVGRRAAESLRVADAEEADARPRVRRARAGTCRLRPRRGRAARSRRRRSARTLARKASCSGLKYSGRGGRSNIGRQYRPAYRPRFTRRTAWRVTRVCRARSRTRRRPAARPAVARARARRVRCVMNIVRRSGPPKATLVIWLAGSATRCSSAPLARVVAGDAGAAPVRDPQAAGGVGGHAVGQAVARAEAQPLARPRQCARRRRRSRRRGPRR